MDPKFVNLLSSMKVADLPPAPVVVEVSANDTFEVAFGKLVKHNILSAPVYDEKTKSYVGFIDLRDLVSIVLAVVNDFEGAPIPACGSIDELLALARQRHAYQAEGATVTYMARRNPFVPVGIDASVYDVAMLLIKQRTQRVRRIPVVKDGKVVNVLSQTTIVKFMSQHVDLLPHASQTLEELGIGTRPVQAVPESTSALDTFKLLDNRQLSGVAIVSADGRLTGNISGRDLKQFITNPHLEKLKLPIRKFLNEIHMEDLDIRAPAITVFPNHTFSFLVQKLAATKVHRIFIVDGDRSFRPTVVVSLTDTLRAMMK